MGGQFASIALEAVTERTAPKCGAASHGNLPRDNASADMTGNRWGQANQAAEDDCLPIGTLDA
jgi:hypothetical protein